MKHAYLIIAHNNFELLQILVRMLDDKRNDIYIHYDKKIKTIPSIYCNSSKLYILNNRFDVRWGDLSLVKVELELFETAFREYNYDYYHLISGVDLPIKSNDYIHNFFTNNRGKEYIGYYQGKKEGWINNVNKFHLLTRFYKIDNKLFSILISIFRTVLEYFLNLFWQRKNGDSEFRKGAEWCSLTNACVGYLLANKTYILERYKWTCCADEIYKQTIIWNSLFKKNIYNEADEYESCMRLIDWNRGNPYIWEQDESDYTIITNSKCLFARKFDKRFIDIIIKIENNICPK